MGPGHYPVLPLLAGLLCSQLRAEPGRGSGWQRGHVETLLSWRKAGLQFCEKNPAPVGSFLLVLAAA